MYPYLYSDTERIALRGTKEERGAESTRCHVVSSSLHLGCAWIIPSRRPANVGVMLKQCYRTMEGNVRAMLKCPSGGLGTTFRLHPTTDHSNGNYVSYS